MAYVETDVARRKRQEEKDYQQWQKIAKQLIKLPYKLEQQPDGCSVDVRMTGYTTNGKEVKYCIELKSQSNIDYYIREYGGPYIKTDKYNYMQKERRDDERMILCYLCTDGRYYLYDVDDVIGNIPTKELRAKSIYLQDSQYYKEGCYRKTYQWCYVLDINKAKVKGMIYANNKET